MNKADFRRVALVPLLLCFAAPGHAQEGRLPQSTVSRLCADYEGKSALISDGAETKITCAWITRMSEVPSNSLIPVHRAILGSARSLSGLQKAGVLPSDLSCGSFEVRTVASERAVVCSGNFGDIVPVTFFATADGLLKRVEISFDYKSLYRAALKRAVQRGTISSFREAYVDLQADLQVAKLRYTATARDAVTIEGNKVLVRVAAP